MSTCDLTYGPLHGGWHVQTKYAPFITSILDRILERFEYMVHRYSKVLFIRFDLRYPVGIAYPQDNLALQAFVNNLTQYLRRKETPIEFQYVWVMEYGKQTESPELAGRYHYHFVLLLNGCASYSSYNHIEAAERLWGRVLGNPDADRLIYDCRRDDDAFPVRNGVLICRNLPDFRTTFDNCYCWASYLAKTETKDHAPYHVRSVGYSQLPEYAGSHS